MKNSHYDKGTFSYDLDFLKNHDEIIVLENEKRNARIIVSPKFQGKVFTSTAEGLSGKSFGWVNYEAVSSEKVSDHINPYGGEDRLWLGPEGGRFSIFFEKGCPMDYENWRTPREIDIESWNLKEILAEEVSLEKEFKVRNYQGFTIKGRLDRKIALKNKEDLEKDIGCSLKNEDKWVGYSTENVLTNLGDLQWSPETGTLNLWNLGMFSASDSAVIFLPLKSNDIKSVLTDNYFGKIDDSRLKVKNGMVFYKGDGKSRGKIGLNAKGATSWAGSYDYKEKILTLVHYSTYSDNREYINQVWDPKLKPFNGDVVNSYNDGPLEDGSQLGLFYELESSSPAAFLSPGDSVKHFHNVYHFVGDNETLDSILFSLFDVKTDDLKKAL